jgi:uncharacterized protein YfaS (alpha-2-macroglobulin family)
VYNKALDFLQRGLQEGAARLPAKAAAAPASIAATSTGLWEENRVRDNGRYDVLTFGAYVLSRNNKAPLSTLRQLYELRSQSNGGLSVVQLGIALKQMGDRERSNTALAEGVKKPRIPGYWWWDYGSALRDAALSYALLEKHQLTPDGRENLLAVISSDMDRYHYYSTQEKLALFLVGRANDGNPGNGWSAGWTSAGNNQDLSGKGTVFHEVSAADLGSGIKIANKSTGNLYLELALAGNPAKMPAARSDLVDLSRKMYTPDGREIGNRPLKVGETVIVRLTARTHYFTGTGMIVDRIPAGLEIENTNIVQGEQMGAVTIDNINPVDAMNNARVKHVEFRDDRFVVALPLTWNTVNLFYRARVVTPGKFVMPPLYAEDMYRPDIYGLTGGSETLTVVEAKPVGEAAKTAEQVEKVEKAEKAEQK